MSGAEKLSHGGGAEDLPSEAAGMPLPVSSLLDALLIGPKVRSSLGSRFRLFKALTPIPTE